MELYLIRHADALALGERGITEDAERPLSEKGENQAHQVGTTLHKRGIAFDKLVTSPLVRARQTTDLILQTWNGQPPPEVHVCEDLAPDAKPRKLAKFLRQLGGEHIALIGHLPHIAHWAGWLLGSKKAQIEFAKAGMALITCGDGPRKGTGVMQWLVTPAWFE
jgi:phosphohistidine phosphatase